MMDDRLYTDAALVQFYDLENGWATDTAFCARLAQDAESVLDLGCGTGLFAARMAQEGRQVTGVDPAAAMLDVARARPGGHRARWVEEAAQVVRLDQTFDLVVLTGHAFQVFLTEADRRAVLETIRAHLAPGGRFIFDSRNPAVEEWREWVPAQSERVVLHSELGRVRAWNDTTLDPATDIVTYWTYYELPGGRVLSAESRIAFPEKAEIQRLLDETRLEAVEWYGDWQGGPLGADRPEIIPFGRAKGV